LEKTDKKSEKDMKKGYFFVLLFVCALVLGGCVISTNPPVADTLPSPTVALPPLPTTSPSPTLQSSSSNPTYPTTSIPVTWADLDLAGKLVYLSASQQDNNPVLAIQVLDLSNGEVTTVFQAPSLAWIYSAMVSPDNKQIVVGYSQPAAVQNLYVMPLDGSQPPTLLFSSPTKGDEYLQPTWSPDGKYLYFVHVNYLIPPETPEQHYPIFEIYRMAYPDGPLEKLVDKAYWPRLSADSSRLVYVSENPNDGTNKLFIANADGSNPQEVVLTGSVIPSIIDAPIFSPDDGSILFSAVTPVQSSAPTWLERLMGVIVASAHSLPSDWWQVPITGGTPVQLTQIQAPGLYASYSPDYLHLASFSGLGIFVMNPDGSGGTMLVNDVGGILGTVDWIP
jgi:Tol biopolymer transport system component